MIEFLSILREDLVGVDELLAPYFDDMTDRQLKILTALVEFWTRDEEKECV